MDKRVSSQQLCSIGRSRMDVFKTRYFKYSRLQLLLIGLWPYQNKLIAMSIQACLIIIVAVFVNGEIQHIIKSRDQLQLFIEPIPYLVTACGVSIKYFTSIIHSETIRETMTKIQYDWNNAALNHEDRILKANAEEGWRFCRSYILIIYAYTSTVVGFQILPEIFNMSISNNVTRFLQHIRGELLLDQDKYHGLILSYVTVSFLYCVLASAALNQQWFLILNHACGMFAIFGHRLEHVFYISSTKRDRRDSVKKILAQTVEYHKEIIKFINTVNSTYSAYYMPLALMAIIILSTFFIQAFIALKGSSSLPEVVLLAMFSSVCIWYMFADCLPAQRLIDASSKVFRQIYNGEWYTASNSDQKALLFIMQNCMEPLTITTNNILTISLEQYGMIIRVSMSCFTVLYSLS